ncbi:MAG TPA: amidohydrolase [Propionibacteriaceae bacterium]|nr:amidohydrolase [Propionibacteriaceae bacterium]
MHTGSDEARQRAIASGADDLFPRLVAIRRDIHAHPEVGYAEHRTTAAIMDLLSAEGLAPEVLSVGTGAVCDVVPHGWPPSSGLIALRADIDALPIADAKSVDYASTHPGVCHACGHDVHTTIVLGVAMLLVRLRNQGLLKSGVRLIFQPAEEASPGGALDAIDSGVLKQVDEAYALHCDPRTDVGCVGMKVGAITSATERVRVTLTGRGGHTSRPHLTADLVGALGALATTAPLLLTRRVDPRSAASLVWGRVQAGSAANAIPQHGELEGTLRALDLAGWETATRLLPDLVREVVAPFGVGVEVHIDDGVPPTINSAEGVHRLRYAAESMLGPSSATQTEQSMGGEDFGWMLQQVPGAMGRLGVRVPGQVGTPDIHQPTFDVDERCIPIGVKLLTEVATSAR